MITLRKAVEADCPLIHRIQVKCFISMLKKYRDFESSPASESLDRVQQRFRQSFTDYYLIYLGDLEIGMVRVCDFGETCRISPICVLPEYQGRGYAKQAMLLLETQYPDARQWTLDTIEQEEDLCRFYESMGYRRTGETSHIMDGMDLVYYAKGV